MRARSSDWEAFRAGHRKPGYVPGFELVHRTSEDAVGIRFKARKLSIAKDYAVEFFKIDAESGDALARELAALPMLTSIDHWNLVAVEDRGEVDGIPYLVLGWAGGTTLRQRLARGPCARDEARRVVLQLARAVEALHAHALVHLAVEPAHVFVTGDVVRLGGWGRARLATGRDDALSLARSATAYVAPERRAGAPECRSDLFALGALLCECLSGTAPAHASECEPAPLPSGLPEPERAAIVRCLERDPAARFASASALLAALLAGSPPLALETASPRSIPAVSLPSCLAPRLRPLRAQRSAARRR